jgi:hypothetical protein
LGFLTVQISDPSQESSNSFPTAIPTITPSKNSQNNIGSIKALIIKIQKIEVHLLQANGNSLDEWETLDVPYPISVDLFQLIDSSVINLSTTKLAAGNYSEIRVYIENATTAFENKNEIPLKISGKENTVRILQNFIVNKSKTTSIILDFDAKNSIVKNGNDFFLKLDVTKLIIKN